MTREILFKGKSKTDGVWYHSMTVSSCILDNKKQFFLELGKDIEAGIFACLQVIPETLTQYTGINIGEHKLFFGDLVRADNDIYECVFHEEGFCVMFLRIKSGIKRNPLYVLGSNTEYIGHKYDHPEFFKL